MSIETPQNAHGWEIDEAARVLRAHVTNRQHPLFGPGSRLSFDEKASPRTRLDLYPERLVARFHSSVIRLDLINVWSVRAAEEQVILGAGTREVESQTLIYPSGEASFALLRQSQPTTPPAEQSMKTEAASAAADSPDSDELRADRVVFTGRLGRSVTLRTTARGRIVGRVPLAVHQGEMTIWHNLLFFDEAAEKAAAELTKGAMVTVIGYRHVRDVTGRDGITKQVEEIYAASVQRGK